MIGERVGRIRGEVVRLTAWPGNLPFDLAARIPALVRSEVRSRWATAPSTCRENIPWGVDVSMESRSERKCTPRAFRASTTSSRWLTDRLHTPTGVAQGEGIDLPICHEYYEAGRRAGWASVSSKNVVRTPTHMTGARNARPAERSESTINETIWGATY